MSKTDEKKQKEAEVVEYLRQRSRELASSDTARKNKNITTVAGRDSLFLEHFDESLEKVFKKHPIKPPKYVTKAGKKTKRILNVMLSDLHFGAMLDGEEVPIPYGAKEEARRLAEICKQAADYKPQYRNETELYCHLLGDVIQGKLHDVQAAAPISIQVASAIHLLIQAVVFLSSQFPNGVKVFATTGNHSRIKERHPGRAVDSKWDSLESIIYYGVKKGCANLPNVSFEIPKTPFYTYQAFDKRGFMSHGDGVLSIGYPSSSINVGKAHKKINEINAAETKKGLAPFSLFGIGHLHSGSQTHLPNGAIFITNGALIPPDPYALSIGIFETNCGQQLWESVPGFIMGDSRFVEVNEETDKDASLDQIIKPFTGF